MRLIIKNDQKEVAVWAASHIVKRINEKAATTDAPFVLGLPTGSTPIGTYEELIRMHKEGAVSFRNVIKTSTYSTGMQRTLRKNAPATKKKSSGPEASTCSWAESAKTDT